MSEVSSNYHIRTDDHRSIERQLREARQAGLVFGPANGWLSFVPYENLSNFRHHAAPWNYALQLCKLVRAPVMHYMFAEDHGWGIALAAPDRPLNRFAVWWDPSSQVEREQFDLQAFAAYAPAVEIEAHLRPLELAGSFNENPAYRVAALLRLPAYKWLSPDLVQKDTGHFLTQGGRKLGTKPRSPEERLQLPPQRLIRLPRPELSAREALALIEPAANLDLRWRIVGLAAILGLSADGRCSMNTGWEATFRRRSDLIAVALVGNGRLSFQGDRVLPLFDDDLDSYLSLQEIWLDSTEIARIVASVPRPEDASGPPSLFMSLFPAPGVAPTWQALLTFAGQRPGRFVQLVLHIDARSGQMVSQSLEHIPRNSTPPAAAPAPR